MTAATDPSSNVFVTDGADHVHAHLQSVYGPHRLSVDARALRAQVVTSEVGQLHLGSIQFNASALVSMIGPHGHWVFSMLHAGQARVRGQDEAFSAGDAGVMTPDMVAEISMSPELSLNNLRVADLQLQRACAALLGADAGLPRDWLPKAPSGSAPALALRRTWAHLTGLPRLPGAAATQLENQLQDAVLYELLLTWPHSLTRHLAAPVALPRSVRRAQEFIHEQAQRAPRLAEIAAAAGVGVRALTRGFERCLGMAPGQYMLNFRLEQIRAGLLRGRPDTSITQLALEWGFSNPGALAVRYRQRFGERPSQTLSRGKV